MAVGTAVSVSAMYLSQPLLSLLAGVFHISVREMGLVATITQVGFGSGLIFLVPLGDVIAKKRLILAKLVLVALALVATGMSSSFMALALGSLGVGLFATAAQDFVPLAAELSLPEKRGHAIGTVMSGLLLGILGSRILSGALAEWAGWRAPFFALAALALVIAVLVWHRVPRVEQEHQSTYAGLLRSMAELVGKHPLLILSTVGQGFVALTFSAFWTMLSFRLSEPLFNLSPSRIGAFALAGFAGAAAAPVAGRLADRHGPLFNIRCAIAILGLSFGSMLLAPHSLAALATAAVTFDLGVQMSMVSHQTIIYGLEPRARSRINAVYVGGLFVFFALGSFGASWAYARAGWSNVVLLCLASCGLAVVAHVALTITWNARMRRTRENSATHRDAPPSTTARAKHAP